MITTENVPNLFLSSKLELMLSPREAELLSPLPGNGTNLLALQETLLGCSSKMPGNFNIFVMVYSMDQVKWQIRPHSLKTCIILIIWSKTTPGNSALYRLGMESLFRNWKHNTKCKPHTLCKLEMLNHELIHLCYPTLAAANKCFRYIQISIKIN